MARSRRWSWLLLPLVAACAPAVPATRPTPIAPPRTVATRPAVAPRLVDACDDCERGAGLDDDGVLMILPSAPGGTHLALGARDPNTTSDIFLEKHTPATAASDGALHYWKVTAYDLDYASGGEGKTTRLHLHASGGTQHFTWRTQHGFLSSIADVRDQEFTAYVRAHDLFDPARAAVTLKIRGGAHSTKDGDLASCVMLTFEPGNRGRVTRFGKELTHPLYDYVKLTPRFAAALVDDRWVGLKMVSFGVPGDPARVVDRLYVDDDPIDAATGRPRNRWRLFAEFVDEAGHSTGRYDTLVDWGGWQTTLRSDGIGALDFALVSVRAVTAPPVAAPVP